jgi:tRNA (adenine57-N1/adenine58-N1)-methyltransferase
MSITPSSTVVHPGELVQLVSPSNKTYFVRAISGGELQTHRGVVRFDDLIGLPWGSRIFSHLGSTFFLLQPGLADIIKETRRNTQIMYPKDIGFILMTLNIGPGVRVIEAGTGSGAMTTALAWAVGTTGKVISYEARPEMQNLAKKNLERLSLAGNVEFRLRDIAEGFKEQNVDALFLDLPNPFDYMAHVRAALKPGGFFGCILPTFNQVEKVLLTLYQYQFGFTDVCEILLRYYKPIHNRLRPTDRMVAHTGYLIFSRPIVDNENISIQEEDVIANFDQDQPD